MRRDRPIKVSYADKVHARLTNFDFGVERWMFGKFFKKTPKTGSNPPKIQLSLTFLGFAADSNGIMLGWRAKDAPSDVMFDLDFLGQPSSITTVFLWDSQGDVLKNVFFFNGDTSFRIKAGWAYAGNAMDGSGNVECVWVFSGLPGHELKFEQGHQVTVDLVFDPKQRKIRTPT